MEYLMDPTVITILLLIGIILLIVWWDRGTSRSDMFTAMPVYEDNIRRRGLVALLPLLRSYRTNPDTTQERLQELMSQLSEDEVFARQILLPAITANMGTIVSNRTLLVQLDMELRTHYGYRLKPIHMTTYGIRPETVLHATSEENDMCMKEVQSATLAMGKKSYVNLASTEEAPEQ